MSKAVALKEALMLKLYGKKPSLAKHLLGGGAAGSILGGAATSKGAIERGGMKGVEKMMQRLYGTEKPSGLESLLMLPVSVPAAVVGAGMGVAGTVAKRGALGSLAGAGTGAALYAKRLAKYQARRNKVNAALAGTGLAGLGGLLAAKSMKK